jgi:hypothetical protein
MNILNNYQSNNSTKLIELLSKKKIDKINKIKVFEKKRINQKLKEKLENIVRRIIEESSYFE